MTKYRAYFSNTKSPVKVNEEGDTAPKELGFVTFFHFSDNRVTLLSKAFLMATGAQQDADKVEFLKVS